MTRSRRACSRAPLVVLGATRVTTIVGIPTIRIFQVGFHFFHKPARFHFSRAFALSHFTFSLSARQPAARRISPLFYFTHPTRDCCQKYTCRA